jgi:hypothetical protein
VSSADNCASLYWSCPVGLPGDWRDRLCAWHGSSAVAWLAVEVSEERLGLIDDEGRRVALDISRPRPNGIIACSSGPKLVLGVLRVGQLLGFSLANESMEKIDLSEVAAVLSSPLFSTPYDTLEDLAMAIGLAPRAFRLRQLEVAAIPDKDVFF